MLVTISLLSEVPIWTPESLSAKIAGSGDTLHSHAESKVLNVSNATVHISQNTIVNSDGATKPMLSSTCQDWKPRKVSLALTHSNVQIITEIIKLTPTCVCSRGTDSIGNGIRRSMPRSVKTDPNPFVLKWMVYLLNDHQKPQDLFAKHSKELSHH